MTMTSNIGPLNAIYWTFFPGSKDDNKMGLYSIYFLSFIAPKAKDGFRLDNLLTQ